MNAGLLFYKLRKHDIFRPQTGWSVFLLKVGIALSVMGLALWSASGNESAWLANSLQWRVGRMSMLVAIGITTYFGSLWILGFRLRDFAKRSV